jgi:hypothetical protein
MGFGDIFFAFVHTLHGLVLGGVFCVHYGVLLYSLAHWFSGTGRACTFLVFFSLISWLIGRLVLYLILFFLFVTDWALVGLGRFSESCIFLLFIFSLV